MNKGDGRSVLRGLTDWISGQVKVRQVPAPYIVSCDKGAVNRADPPNTSESVGRLQSVGDSRVRRRAGE